MLIAGALSQLSVAVAVPVTAVSVLTAISIRSARQVASVMPGVHSTVISPGQVMAGAAVSTTVMIWSQFELFPQLSVAVQERVITSSCGQVPVLALSAKLIAGASSQLSVALALPPVLAGLVFCTEATRVVIQLPSAVAPISAVHCTVTLAGQVIEGATMSRMVIV